MATAVAQAKLPPGPKSPPVWQTFNWMRQPDEVMKAGRKAHGDVWTVRLAGGTTFVIVSDLELVKQIFTADPAVLKAGEANRRIGIPLLGAQSVIVLDEDAHMAKRKLLQPAFHGERMKRYHDLMVELCEQELATWPLNEPLELLPRMQAITLNVIMTAIFGVTGGPEQERLAERIRTMLAWGENRLNLGRLHFTATRGSALPKSFLRTREPLDKVVFEELERARSDPRLEERDDILAMLLKARYEDGSPMSDRELRDQMITLLIQGHNSTATAISWTLERLIRHPQAHERLRDEVKSGSDDYLDAVVHEGLRVRPPLAYVLRHVTEPYILGDRELEAGVLVAPCIYLIHHREDLYPDPYKFRPERWLDQKPGTYTWIPFGGGQRHCVGRSFATAEIKQVLRTLVQRTRLEPVDDADERIRRRGILLTPSRNARAVLRERVAAD